MLKVMCFTEKNSITLQMMLNEWLDAEIKKIYSIQYQIDSDNRHCAMVVYDDLKNFTFSREEGQN